MTTIDQCKEMVWPDGGYHPVRCNRTATIGDYCSAHSLKYGDHETTTWFRVSKSMLVVGTVQVIKETNKKLVIKGGRWISKMDGWYCYFPTQAEAHHYVGMKLEDRLIAAEAAVVQARENMEEFENMQMERPE